jgi:hypothetical protein
MKRKLMLAGLALFFIGSAMGAEPLPDTDKMFVYLRLFTVVAAHTCGAKEIDGGLKKFAERTGLDYPKMYKAIAAAYAATTGREYDSSDLIPDVTVLVNSTLDGLVVEVGKDKAATCAKIIAAIKDRGTIE